MSFGISGAWLILAVSWLFFATLSEGAATAGDAKPATSMRMAGCPPSSQGGATPLVDVRTFGALGNGLNDDTRAIQDAIASLEKGGTVLFPPGTYRHDDILVVTKPNVSLAGQGAVLLAGNPARAAIFLAGENSAIRDLAITSRPPGARGDRDEQSGVVVSGTGNAVEGNTVSGFKNAGILVLGGRDYVVACNHVFDTKSDGIHSTDGASGGRVTRNSVHNSGDDGIAVVSYRPKRRASAITIEDNSVEHIRWGRGISVIGSTDAVIRRNRIKSIAMAAGIIVAREASWDTPGAGNVIIEDNTILDIQQTLAPLDGRPRTGHAAIELNSDSDDPALGVSDVSIIGNSVNGSAYDGIRLHGNVTRVAITANELRGVRGHPIAVSPGGGRVLKCSDNKIENRAAPCER